MDVELTYLYRQAILFQPLPLANRTNFIGELNFSPLVVGGHKAQTVTVTASSIRTVKRKVTGFKWLKASPAVRAGQPAGKIKFLPTLIDHHHASLGQLQAAAQSFPETTIILRFQSELINQNFKIMLLIFIQADFLFELNLPAINPGFEITPAPETFQ